MRAEGVVSAAYQGTDGAGLIGIVHGTDLAAVKANLGRLPFVDHGFMAFEYVEMVRCESVPAEHYDGGPELRREATW